MKTGTAVPRAREVFRRLACAAVLLLPVWSMGAAAALAQMQPGRPLARSGSDGRNYYALEGYLVLGGEGAPVHNAQVVLTNSSGAYIGTQVTDNEGLFIFYDLPEGTYTITATHPSFGRHVQTVEVLGGPVRGLLVKVPEKTSAETLGTATVPLWATRIPDEARRSYEAARKEMQAGRHRQSLPHLEEAVRLYPEFAAAHAAMGSAHLILGGTEAAARAYERALAIDENLPDACLGLGALYSSAGRHQQAEVLLLRALRLRPADARVEYELGQLYARMKDWPKAEEHLRGAVEADAAVPKRLPSRVYLLLVNARVQQEKYAAAMAAMDEFLRLYPNDPFAPQVREKRKLLEDETAGLAPAKPPRP